MNAMNAHTLIKSGRYITSTSQRQSLDEFQVNIFDWRQDDETGEWGWKLRGFDEFDPIPTYAFFHDLVEHGNFASHNFSSECLAFGFRCIWRQGLEVLYDLVETLLSISYDRGHPLSEDDFTFFDDVPTKEEEEDEDLARLIQKVREKIAALCIQAYNRDFEFASSVDPSSCKDIFFLIENGVVQGVREAYKTLKKWYGENHSLNMLSEEYEFTRNQFNTEKERCMARYKTNEEGNSIAFIFSLDGYVEVLDLPSFHSECYNCDSELTELIWEEDEEGEFEPTVSCLCCGYKDKID